MTLLNLKKEVKKMAKTDNTVLCVFSGNKCILIDDCNQKILDRRPIKSIWPDLSNWSMDSDLDAVCRDWDTGQFVFFKKENCAVYNYREKKWSHGKITDYFTLPNYFSSNLVAAAEGPGPYGVAEIFLYKDQSYVNGATTDLTKSKAILSGPNTIQSALWTQITSNQKVIGNALICWPKGQSGGIGQLENGILLKDDDGKYQCTFFETDTFIALDKLWPGYNDYPVNAVTRVDASLVGNGNTTNPIPGPGPVIGPNSLCDDLPTIMKSVCSLTVLMHKVVDACYPQSSWPTQPYPDGCGSGHKGDCGCKDKQKETASIVQKTMSSGQ